MSTQYIDIHIFTNEVFARSMASFSVPRSSVFEIRTNNGPAKVKAAVGVQDSLPYNNTDSTAAVRTPTLVTILR